MNCHARTPANKKRLRLKSFFKRCILIFIAPVEKSLNVRSNGHENQGSSTGNRKYKRGSIRYNLIELKCLPSRMLKRSYMITYKKSVLLGKVVLINGTRCRVSYKYQN